LTASFDLYAHDLTVRTSHLDATHLFFTPTNGLPYLPERLTEPLSLQVAVPAGWRIATGLQPAARSPDEFLAADYDELVDSPLHAGTDPVLEFEVDGRLHQIATWGRTNMDPDRLTADLARIVSAQSRLFGGLPYDRYVFILMTADEGRGGLEHRNSCAILAPRFDFRPGPAYERVLRLLSHEFFHTWNVKRIRPEVLGPFDYSAEAYTRLLWAMEGITDYYAALMLRRAGIITADRLLEIYSEWMGDLSRVPGRFLQSLEEASFDAWIKYYRPDEHSANSSISYYLKGALASMLLDLEIRRRTGGARSLDDLMRLLWERFGVTGRGVPEGGYQALVEEIAGGEWTAFFDEAIRGRDDLTYAGPLAAVGLAAEWSGEPNAPDAWLGINLRSEGGRTRISSVPSDSPAWEAGLTPGDELLALDGFRVSDSSLPERLKDFSVGQTVRVSVFRRDELLDIPVTLARRSPTRVALRSMEDPTPSQRALRDGWLDSL
jgi:predicted metalloprotease with PDZ domain